MRKVVGGLFMSLDGVVDADAASPHAWTTAEMMDVMAAGLAEADTVLLGLATYRVLAGYWQHESEDLPMAKFLNHSHKYVASPSPQPLDWGPASRVGDNLHEEVLALKRQPGKNIHIPGSPLLVRGLLREGLLDELYLNGVVGLAYDAAG